MLESWKEKLRLRLGFPIRHHHLGIGRPDVGIYNNLVPDGNILVTKAVWIREDFSSLIAEQKTLSCSESEDKSGYTSLRQLDLLSGTREEVYALSSARPLQPLDPPIRRNDGTHLEPLVYTDRAHCATE